MTKVKYNGEYIDLCDELEPGYEELDLLDAMDDNLVNLEDTQEIRVNNLEDTQIIDLGDNNE